MKIIYNFSSAFIQTQPNTSDSQQMIWSHVVILVVLDAMEASQVQLGLSGHAKVSSVEVLMESNK